MERIEAGLVQRLVALNRFIADVYVDQTSITEGVIPTELVLESKGYLPERRGATPAHGVWAHICGSDLVRDADGTVYVLEDDLRVPSGVCYMLENRLVTKAALACKELAAILAERPETSNAVMLNGRIGQITDALDRFHELVSESCFVSSTHEIAAE